MVTNAEHYFHRAYSALMGSLIGISFMRAFEGSDFGWALLGLLGVFLLAIARLPGEQR